MSDSAGPKKKIVRKKIVKKKVKKTPQRQPALPESISDDFSGFAEEFASTSRVDDQQRLPTSHTEKGSEAILDDYGFDANASGVISGENILDWDAPLQPESSSDALFDLIPQVHESMNSNMKESFVEEEQVPVSKDLWDIATEFTDLDDITGHAKLKAAKEKKTVSKKGRTLNELGGNSSSINFGMDSTITAPQLNPQVDAYGFSPDNQAAFASKTYQGSDPFFQTRW